MRAEYLEVVAVLLAAGMSRRMGERNKLLIEIGGVPLVRRTARVYIDAGAAVHAVLGHDAVRVRGALADLPISFTTNSHYADGQQSSVRAGIESLAGGYDAVLVALADQAALTPADIANLLQSFAASGGNHIMIPYFRGVRGNPVVFPSALIEKMRLAGRNVACRNFIDRNPQLTLQYESPNDHFVIDIDTAEDLAAMEGRLLLPPLNEPGNVK
jgi:molybdenum cofactor cytidylyltransferase